MDFGRLFNRKLATKEWGPSTPSLKDALGGNIELSPWGQYRVGRNFKVYAELFSILHQPHHYHPNIQEWGRRPSLTDALGERSPCGKYQVSQSFNPNAKLFSNLHQLDRYHLNLNTKKKAKGNVTKKALGKDRFCMTAQMWRAWKPCRLVLVGLGLGVTWVMAKTLKEEIKTLNEEIKIEMKRLQDQIKSILRTETKEILEQIPGIVKKELQKADEAMKKELQRVKADEGFRSWLSQRLKNGFGAFLEDVVKEILVWLRKRRPR